MSESSFRLRLACDAAKPFQVLDKLTGAKPLLPRASSLRIELGRLRGTVLADVANFASIRLQVRAAEDVDSAVLMDATTGSINAALVLADWKDDSDQHAVLEFTAAETNLDLGDLPSKEFWLAVWVTTTDSPAHTYLLLAGAITFQEGPAVSVAGPVQGGSVIPGGAAYDGSGNYTLTGLTVNRVYKWSPGANDTDITCGSQNLTVEGNFTAQATSATLTGTPSAAVTATVRANVYLTAEESDARYLLKSVPAWAAITQFYTGNLCSNQGGVWIAEQDSLNQAPPTLPTESNAYWRLILAPGADGADSADGADGADGAAGVDGTDAYIYVAFASDSSGTGFSLTPSAGLTYIAFKASATALTPVVGDFAGLWVKYIGTDGAGAGDMILALAQTVTGAKLFANGTLRAANASGGAKTTFRFAGTSDQEHTLPAKTGTLRLQPTTTAVTYGATMAIDFDVGTEWQEIALTGNVAFTLANAADGKVLMLHIMADDTARTLSWPAFVSYGLPLPTTLGPNDELLVVLRATGTTAAHVIATPLLLSDSYVSYSETTISATGSTAVEVPARRKIHSHLFTVSDTYGGGAWTHDVYFPVAGAVAGDRIFARASLPASKDVTLKFRNASAAGTELLIILNVSFASELSAEFVFDGTEWTLAAPYTWRTAAGAPVENVAARGTVTYGASLAIDLDGPTYQEITATGALEVATSSGSRAASGEAKSVTLLITASGGDRVITLAAGIKGTADTLPSGKTAALCLVSCGSNESDTLAAYAQLN